MSNYKLVPIPPTPEMVEAAEEAYMPFGDMDLAIRMAILAAPDVQGEPVAVLLINEPERTERGLELGDWDIAPDATAIEAFARLAGPGAYQLYLATQPAEQKPATDVAGLVEALEQVVKAAPSGGPLWHGSEQIVEARAALAAYRKQEDDV